MSLTLELPLDPETVAAFQSAAAQQGQHPAYIAAALVWTYVQQYRREQQAPDTDPEPLVNLNIAELQALATSGLAAAEEERLASLLADQHLRRLTPSEQAELDGLLARLDVLNLIKARAAYTLQQLQL